MLPVTLRVVEYQRRPDSTMPTFSLSERRISIGRSPRCDWTLPDPNKFLSGHHCSVVLEQDTLLLEDHSSNGMLHNGNALPQKQNVVVELKNNDTIQLGEYQILVEIGENLVGGISLSDPFADLVSSGNKLKPRMPPPQSNAAEPEDPFALLRTSPPPPLESTDTDYVAIGDIIDSIRSQDENRDSQNALFDRIDTPGGPSNSSIPDNWFEKEEQPYSNRSANIQNNALDDALAQFSEGKHSTQKNTQNIATVVDSPAGDRFHDPLLHFSSGLEVDRSELCLSEKETLEIAGRLISHAVSGLREILALRSNLKNELHLDTTTFAPEGNNPIKVGYSNKDALTRLLNPDQSTYLPAVAAVDEVVRDIQAHESAMISAIQAAMKGIVDELNPESLEARLVEENPISANIPVQRAAKLWSLFEEKYEELQQQATRDFEFILQKAFASHYRDRVAKLRPNVSRKSNR